MSRLVTIADNTVELGVIPDLGGMVSLLHIIGKPNVLKTDETLWDKPPAKPRAFGPDPVWKSYNGHIVWLGPQRDWWTQQDVSEKKLFARDVWPPDPYINQGYFKVIERGATSIVMEGPDSVYSGVRLVKSISIKGGKVHFKVSARNIRATPVSWDLWFNTRVGGYARCYAPVVSLDKVRIDGREDADSDKGVYLHDQGYIYIDPMAPSENKKERWAKAFIPASRGMMAAFTAGQAFVIRFKRHAARLIHPAQALVEFYNYTSHDKEDALTELEYHSPYVTLQPGETMEASQTWDIYPFKSHPSHGECVDFLESK